MVEVRQAQEKDFTEWLLLAREVEPLFGPMADVPEFTSGLADAIRNGIAYTAVNKEQAVIGGVIISPDNNEILWLAVSQTSRGKGAGKALMRRIMSEFDTSQPIHVTTFASNVAEGEAAIRLYSAFGFKCCEECGCNPAGIPIMVMRTTPQA